MLLSMHDNYGKRAEGPSFEHWAFYRPLSRMLGENLIPFDFVAMTQEYGRAEVERMILATIDDRCPDALLVIPFNDATTPALDFFGGIAKARPWIKRWMWSCDSTWRYQTLDKPWSAVMDKIITTSAAARVWFTADHIIGKYAKSQWGANVVDFPNRTPFSGRGLDVAFVGGVHGGRKQYSDALAKSGLKVWIAGQGQPRGRASHEDMVAAYNNARVVLNFSSASQGPLSQLKARIFEASACGACVVTEHHPELAEYYKADEVIQIPQCGPDALVDYLKTLLEQHEYVEGVARRGYKRTMRDHVWEDRFKELFLLLGGVHV